MRTQQTAQNIKCSRVPRGSHRLWLLVAHPATLPTTTISMKVPIPASVAGVGLLAFTAKRTRLQLTRRVSAGGQNDTVSPSATSYAEVELARTSQEKP